MDGAGGRVGGMSRRSFDCGVCDTFAQDDSL
jgi:hypothetical protein